MQCCQSGKTLPLEVMWTKKGNLARETSGGVMKVKVKKDDVGK